LEEYFWRKWNRKPFNNKFEIKKKIKKKHVFKKGTPWSKDWFLVKMYARECDTS